MSARTKFKILVSYYQIVSRYEQVLQIRFPPIFENCMRAISRWVNLDAVKFGSFDCFVKSNFYVKLVSYTIAPVALVLGVVVVAETAIAVLEIGGTERSRRLRDFVLEFSLGLAFLIFSSVSATIFDTFNCRTFGDDPTSYLVVDQSVSCDERVHGKYKMFAGAMMALYPIGIPLLFTSLLVPQRHSLQEAEERRNNSDLVKTSFLWSMYEPNMWWFEVFECFRRLMMTGMLIFVAPGSASQIVVAMLLSIAAIVAFVHWRPYFYEEDDDLAIACQLSIFFTIFGALLIRVDVDDTDDYDAQSFGNVLVGINLFAIALLSANFFKRPLQYAFKIIDNDYFHDGDVITMDEDEVRDDDAFIDYFEKLALSSDADSGFQPAELRTPAWIDWAEEKGATLQWRNDCGSGPINEVRVRFRVRQSMDVIRRWLENEDCELRTALQHYQVGPTGRDGKRTLYTAKKLYFPHRNRDCLMEELNRESKLVPGGHVLVGRSVYNDEIISVKKSSLLGFVRSEMKLKGYMLLPCPDDSESIEVVYVANVNMGGWFAHSKLIFGLKWRLKDIVDSISKLEGADIVVVRAHAEEDFMDEERSSTRTLLKAAKQVSERFKRLQPVNSAPEANSQDGHIEMQNPRANRLRGVSVAKSNSFTEAARPKRSLLETQKRSSFIF
jgi:hypothetical protein